MRSQEGPGRPGEEELRGAKRSHESQDYLRGAKSIQEEPGGARSSQEEPRGARTSQKEPGAARRIHEERRSLFLGPLRRTLGTTVLHRQETGAVDKIGVPTHVFHSSWLCAPL